MSEWWALRSERERWLLLVMFALVALVLGWLLIVRPLGDALAAARDRHGAAVVALAEAKARRGLAPAGAAPAPLPVDSLVSRSAADAGFANAQVAGRGPTRANVRIEAGRPQAVFGWVARLEGQGLTVESLRARANADRTLSVEAAFVARSGR